MRCLPHQGLKLSGSPIVGARFLCLLVKINSTCLLHWHGTLAPTPQRRKPIQTLALGRAHTRCKPSKSCLYNYMCIGTFYSQKKFVDTVRCALHKNYTEFNLKIQGNSNLDVEYFSVFSASQFSVFSASQPSLAPTQERDVCACVHRDRVVQIFGTLQGRKGYRDFLHA